jgi:microcystin-dependent protein
VGTILPTGSDHDNLPVGYLLCDGTSYDTTVELTLFTVIGYKFGGSASNFNVPDFRENFPRGAPNLDDGGGTGGIDTVTLTTAQMPIHTHIQNSHTHTQDAHAHTQVGHSHSYNARGNGGAFATGSPSAANASFGSTTGGATPVINGSTAINQSTIPTNQNAGSDNSHENKPPFVECPFMIKN